MKRGGDASRLFEFLKERSERTMAGVKERAPQRSKPPAKPEPGKPRPTLLLGGIEDKAAGNTPPPAPTATNAQAQPGKTATGTRRTALGQYRGKALVIKYDVAMVVALALVGLLVISWVWGYAAGKGAGIRSARERLRAAGDGIAPHAAANEDGAGRPAVRPPITDDGAGEYRIKLMSMGRHTNENRRYFERCAHELEKGEGYPNVLLDEGASHIVLYVGLFKTREAAEKYLGHFRAKDSNFKECYVTKRP